MTKEIALYEIPEVLEEAGFLDASLLETYNGSFVDWNDRAKATLGKMKSAGGELVNSSPLMLVRMLNAGILPSNTRLSTRQDLERAIQFYANAHNGANFTEGIYSDVGLALRTAGDSYAPNDTLAKKLAGQLEHRGVKLGEGVLIPILALTDKQDESEFCGITLDLNDNATRETIRDLGDFKWDYQRKEGLACACRGGSDWYSDFEYLDRSGDVGRVVVVRAEGTPQKILEQRLANYASDREKYLQSLMQLRERIDADLSTQ